MRTASNNGITINYPDSIGFAFNVCLIQVIGTYARADITVNGQTITIYPYSGKAYADIQELVQSQFEAYDFTVEYTQAEKTKQGKSIEVAVQVYNEADLSIYDFFFETFYIWGAMYTGETYNAFRKMVLFPGYPFTFGLYTTAEQGKILVSNDGVATSLIDIDGFGVYNFIIPKATAKEYYDVWDMKGTFAETTFDDTFDLTFRMTFIGKKAKKCRIYVCNCRYEHPVYLRWIDRHGFWNHYLFKLGDEKRSASAEGEYLRNNLASYDGTYGMPGALVRRQSYAREDTMTVCAPLVDSDIFDMLQDIASSPVVDMYDTLAEEWHSVTIKEGTYTKTDDVLQDFELQIVKPQYQLQRL